MAKPPSSVAQTYHLTPHDHMVGNSPLHSACYNGKLDIVKLLILENPSDINGKNHQGNTPLGLACKAGHRHVVSFLLTLNTCDLNHRNKAGNTPLHITSLAGDLGIVSLLCCVRKCKVDPKNRYGDTPLGLACNSGNVDIVEFLVNQKDCNIATQNRDGDTPLHLTCHSGHLGVVKLISNLLDCDLSSTNKDGDTPFHLACQSGWLDIVYYLTTEKGCNLNYQNMSGNIPLYTAIVSQQKDVAMFLCKLEHCDISHINKEGDTALHLASSEGWSDMVDVLVSVRHCDINSQNNQGNTALHIASLKGHKAVIEVLIQQPLCDINRENQHGNTPLSLACQNGWEESVKLLVNIQNCNINHKNKYGITSVHLACYDRHQKIVEILIRDEHCDVECKDMNENTPLGLVCNLGWTDTMEYLITERHSCVDSKNKYGDTPLHLACSGGYLKVVKLLVPQKNCDINCRSNRGDTPFSLACPSSLELVEYLSAQKECETFVRNSDGNTPLHHACTHSRLDIVKFLVDDLKHDVNCENNDGNPPLSWSLACETRWNNIDIVQFFVSLPRCRINHQNKAGDTPLHIACREGHTDAAVLLTSIEHCNFNLQNECGQTPAMIVMNLHHIDILQLMLQEPHHIPSLLTSVNQWTNVINLFLLSRGKELAIPYLFQSKLDAVRFVVQHKLWDPKCPNEHGSIALHFASSDLVEYLVHWQECDVNHQNKMGNTPLHIASLRGDLHAVRALISIEGCNINLQNKEGNTPLHAACLRGDLDAVRALTSIERCTINFQTRNNRGDTAFSLACQSSLKVVEYLSTRTECETFVRNSDGNTPLHHACAQGRLDIVKFLVDDLKHDVNCENNDGNPPLSWSLACETRWKNIDIVQFFVSLPQCHINHQNKEGNIPLHIACQEGHKDAVVLLSSIEHCDFNLLNESGLSPAMVALGLSYTDILKLMPLPSLFTSVSQDNWISIINLLSRGRELTVPSLFQSKLDAVRFVVQHKLWDPKCPNEHGSIALHFASSDLVEYLVQEQECEVNHQNKEGNTPLHAACLRGDLDAVRALTSIERCTINFQTRNNRGDTAFSLACQSSLKVVEYLSARTECETFVRNSDGNTPLHHACAQGRLDIVKFLVDDLKHDVNCENNDGNPPLSWSLACETRWKNIDIVQFFVSLPRCRINHQNKMGDTPLHIACREGHKNAAVLLSSIEHCNFNLQNKCGQTPAMVALGSDILKLMPLPSLFTSVNQDKWINIINFLGRGRYLTVPSHFQSKLDAVKFVVQHKLWDPKCPNEHGSTALHFASSDLVEYLVREQGCDANHQNKRGNTPLHIASIRGDLNTARALTSIEECNINLQNKVGDTPLHIACREGHKDAAVLLTSMEHCDFNLLNKSGLSPAMVALGLNHTDILKLMPLPSLLTSVSQDEWISVINLLSRGRELTVPSLFQSKLDAVKFVVRYKLWDLKCPNERGSTALHFASSDLMKYLVREQGCNVNHQNKKGNTPLHVACLRGDLDAVRALTSIERCNINFQTRNNRGDTAFSLACQSSLKLVEYLSTRTECETFVRNSDGNTPLHHACAQGRLDIVKFLVDDLKHDVNCENNDGNPPLSWSLACETRWNNIDIVQFFVSLPRCRINHQNKMGDTPLHIACREGHKDAAVLLTSIEHCDFNLQNKCGQTPAMVALGSDILKLMPLPSLFTSVNQDKWINIINFLGRGRYLTVPSHFQSKLDAVKFVVQHKLWDPKCPNEHGSTALHFASSDLVEYLVREQGCDANHQNKRGNTPLHIASIRGDLNTARALTSIEECNINLQNKVGDTPLHIACREGHKDAAVLLTSMEHCDFNLLNKSGLSPAMVALGLNHTDILKLMPLPSLLTSVSQDKWISIINLLSRGRELTVPSLFQSKLDAVKFVVRYKLWDPKHPNERGNIALHFASSDLMKYLVREQGCNVNHQNKEGNTPLHAACLRGDLDAVRALTSIERYNINFQTRNNRGDTAFSLACQSSLKVVEYLSTRTECETFVRNSDGNTPLHHACAQGRLDIVKFLVDDLKHDVNCENNDGNTPLSWSLACETRWKNFGIARFFVSLPRCHINHQNKMGDTALHIACREGYKDAVVLLTSMERCNLNLQNKLGQTPAQVALDLNHTKILQLMLQEPHHIPSILASISQYEWTDVINLFLLSRGRVTVPSPFETKLDAVKFVVQHKLWDPKCPNERGSIALHFTISDLVEYLVREQGCNVNRQNKEGNTPLHVACLRGDLDAVRALTSIEECTINFQTRNNRGDTAFSLACQSSLKVVEYLSTRTECETFVQNSGGNTPLHHACAQGSLDIVKFLVNDLKHDVNCENNDGNTPLTWSLACETRWNNIGIVQFFVSLPQCHINHQNKVGDTPLHIACREGHKDAAVLLTSMEHCDFNLLNKCGQTPAQVALGLNHTDILKLMPLPSLFTSVNQDKWITIINLLSRGRELTVPSLFQSKLDAVKFVVQHKLWDPKEHGNIAFHFASSDLVEYLVHELGCDVNHQNKEGNTPLHIASIRGDHDTVRALISIEGCNINLQNKEGNTPLHAACLRGDLDAVRALTSIERCNINFQTRNNRGDTAFSLACQSSLKVVEYLSTRTECETFVRNSDGNTPLHHACAQGSLDIVKFLVDDLKHDVNCENNDGNPPLSWSLACETRWKNIDIVQFFVSLPRCRINHQNKMGDTPLHIACREGHKDAAVLLSGMECCNLNLQNKHSQTPAQVALGLSYTDILKLMPLPSLFTLASKWISIINFLSRGRELTVPSHFQSKLDAVKFVVQHNLWDLKCPNEHGSIALHFASSDLVDYLVREQGCNVNHQNKRGNTPLHVACLIGDLNTVRTLTSIEGCNINLQNIEGYTPLHIACLRGDLDAVVLLSGIEHCDFNLQNESCQTPAMVALGLNHTDILKLIPLPSLLTSVSQDKWISIINLLSRGRELTVPSLFQSKLDAVKFVVRYKLWDPKCPNEHGSIALHFASSDLVEYLVQEQECEVNHQNKEGNTPLHAACLRGDLDAVRALTSIERCTINFQTRNNRGDTAFSLACQSSLKLVEYLSTRTECETFVRNSDGNTPLHHACAQGRLDIVKFLVNDLKHDVNCENNDGNTPLSWSLVCETRWKNIDIVQFFVSLPRCRINHQNKVGDTPMHIACREECLSAVARLSGVEHCNFNLQNKCGQTPAQVAMNLHHIDILLVMPLPSLLSSVSQKNWIIKLLSRGRYLTVPSHFQSKLHAVKFVVQHKLWDPKCPNEHGSTALHFASSDLVEYLVHELGCDANHQNKRGNTPLHVACLIGDLNTARALTSIEGCNINLQNKVGDTPLHIACREGHKDAVVLLNSMEHCNFNLQNKCGQTPAQVAMNHTNILQLIMLNELHRIPSVLTTIGQDKWISIINLLSRGRELTVPSHFQSLLDAVKFVVQHKLWDPKCPNEHGSIALHFASSDLVEYLVREQGCDVNCQNYQRNTPLHVACLRGDSDTVRALTSIAKCNLNHQNEEGNTPLHVACLKGDLDALRVLNSTKGCNFNLQNEIGNTPTHMVCFHGSTEFVHVLLQQHNINLTVANRYNETAIHIAFKRHHIDIVKLFITKQRSSLLMLLKCAIQAEWRDIVGSLSDSNLSIPIFKSYFNVLQFLQSHQICHLTDDFGNNNLHAACSIGDIDLVKFLVIVLAFDPNTSNNKGDTPLHIACRGGKMDIAQFLVLEQNCEVISRNFDGDTLLHEACKHGSLVMVIFLLNYTANDDSAVWVPQLVLPNSANNICAVYRINCSNNVGNTPLHVACLSGKLSIVKILISKKECNYNPLNTHHETPAIIAFNQGHRDILKLLVTEQHCECLLSLLHSTDRHKWADIIHILTGLKTLNEFQHPLEVITFLVDKQYWNLNHPNRYGNTALHYACISDSELVTFLVNDQCCNLNLKNSDGDTPLHVASQQGNLEAVRHILNKCTGVSEPACNLDVPNNQGDTPLHYACSIGHVRIIKMLLSSDLFDPTSVNAAGLTPIDLTTEYQVIKELSAYTKFRSSNSPPVWSNIKVCVIGDHATGKTTLVEVLSKEATRLWKVVPPRFRRVTDIERSTAGIIPVKIQSKKFGNVILYDFAGHKEYYSSHAAVLENFKSKSPPPLFILLLKLTESMKDISEKLYYWTSMIENHCKHRAKPPQVLVVGSFADQVKAKGGSVREVNVHVQKTIKSLRATNPVSDVVTSSLEFVGFVPLDCRVHASGRMDELSDLLAKTCQGLQEAADTSFGCHILYTFLLDRYKGRVACSVAEVMESAKKEDALALYNDAPSLVHLLKSLSDSGEIILLANQRNPNQGWVILESKVLLSEINATVFAPEYLKQYSKGFAMSTGVVPLSKIKEVFPTYDSEMITQFLTHLEFCQEIKDLSILPEIRKTHQMQDTASPRTAAGGGHTPLACYDQERYFFFTALVELEKPVRVWVDDETMEYKCGWLLQCIRPGKFLTTRFLHVLLLRLAFAYGLNPEPHQLPQDDPVLRKRCSVWKSGIQWFSRTGIETIVEVREQTKVVAILMRCPKDKDVECAKLRSSVIGKILYIQQEFCPAVTPMAESLIHPSNVQYPLKDAKELRLFTVNEIANLVIADPSDHETHAMEDIPRGIIDTADLLLFEPYLGLGAKIVQQFFSSDNEITEQFLNQLASQTFERLSMYKKMINPNEARYAELCEQAPFNQVKQCYYLFQLWSERGNATFKALQQLFDGHSIFHERSPLELASSVPQLSGERTNEDDLLEGVNDTELAIDSLLPVRTELVTLTCWSDLGLAVQLLPHTLTAIRTSNRDDIHQCVTEVVAAWLERQGSVSKPSWRSLVKALLSPSINCQTLARRISETHSTSQSKPETYKSTTEHSTAQDNTVVCCGSPQYEDSSFRHDLEIHQPTTEVSMSTVQGVDDDLLDDDSLRDIKDLLMAGGTHLPWFSLGLVLGLQYGTLKAIQDKKHDDHYQYLTDTLAAWLRQEDAVPEQGLPSWKTLARALTHPLVSQRSLVDEITRRHQKTEPSDN